MIRWVDVMCAAQADRTILLCIAIRIEIHALFITHVNKVSFHISRFCDLGYSLSVAFIPNVRQPRELIEIKGLSTRKAFHCRPRLCISSVHIVFIRCTYQYQIVELMIARIWVSF